MCVPDVDGLRIPLWDSVCLLTCAVDAARPWKGMGPLEIADQTGSLGGDLALARIVPERLIDAACYNCSCNQCLVSRRDATYNGLQRYQNKAHFRAWTDGRQWFLRRWRITSDDGGVLLREVVHRTRNSGPLSEICFTDCGPGSSRTPGGDVDQTAGAGAVPYEDLQRPRRVVPGPASLLCDRDDLTVPAVESARGKPLARQVLRRLNRPGADPVEEGPEGAYKKIVADPAGMDRALLDVCGSASSPRRR